MITDFWFYITAIPAVFFYGMGKGGVGGILGMLSVPLMALTVSPIQAAAILLPLLCMMDLMAFYYHRKNCNYAVLKGMLPMAIIGIVIAAYFMESMSSNVVELIIGGLAMAFLAQTFVFKNQGAGHPVKGHLLNALSGFASTIAHAGGPPASMYLLPKKLSKEQLIGTGVVFFLILNFTKLVPYAYIGELDLKNITTSLVLLPVAFIGVKVGVMLVNVISQEMIYKISYVILFITGCKMLYTGIMGF